MACGLWIPTKFSGISLVVYTSSEDLYTWVSPLKPCLGTGEFFNFLSWIPEVQNHTVFFAVFGYHPSHRFSQAVSSKYTPLTLLVQRTLLPRYSNWFASQHQSPGTSFPTFPESSYFPRKPLLPMRNCSCAILAI